MRIPHDRLLHLEATTPPSPVVQERARAYMDTAQLSQVELARRIGYGVSAVRYFMSGLYVERGIAATDVQIRRALVNFMDANPVDVEDAIDGKLYDTANVRMLQHWFDYCLQERDMAAVYGAAGSQKTWAAKYLVAQHNQREIPKNGHGTRAYHIYCSHGTGKRDMLRRMCRAANIPSAQQVPGLISILAFHLGKRKVLFIMDEANHLSIGCLQILRELNENAPRCGILLQGTFELFETFRAQAAALEQWHSRLANFVELPGLSAPEMVQIIEGELGIQPPEQLKGMIDACIAIDPHPKKRNKKYYSARRLFKQIKGIKTALAAMQPTTSTQVSTPQNESAA